MAGESEAASTVPAELLVRGRSRRDERGSLGPVVVPLAAGRSHQPKLAAGSGKRRRFSIFRNQRMGCPFLGREPCEAIPYTLSGFRCKLPGQELDPLEAERDRISV